MLTAAEEIEAIRDWFGPNGENWSQGAYRRNKNGVPTNSLQASFDQEVASTCLAGAFAHIWGKVVLDAYTDARRLCRAVITEQFLDRSPDSSIVVFNDHDDTTWDDVRLVLEKAHARALELL